MGNAGKGLGNRARAKFSGVWQQLEVPRVRKTAVVSDATPGFGRTDRKNPA